MRSKDNTHDEHARDDLSRLLARDEIDVALIGESHADSAARNILIDNIDLMWMPIEKSLF